MMYMYVPEVKPENEHALQLQILLKSMTKKEIKNSTGTGLIHLVWFEKYR